MPSFFSLSKKEEDMKKDFSAFSNVQPVALESDGEARSVQNQGDTPILMNVASSTRDGDKDTNVEMTASGVSSIKEEREKPATPGDAPTFEGEIPGKPPTSWEIAKAGWNILHSSAAVYPYKPSEEQKRGIQQFIHGFSFAYACSSCAYHMRLYLKNHPPEVEDKHTISKYLCRFHNHVNEQLKKPVYDCENVDLLLKRWHPGYPDRMEDKPSWEERMAAVASGQSARSPDINASTSASSSTLAQTMNRKEVKGVKEDSPLHSLSSAGAMQNGTETMQEKVMPNNDDLPLSAILAKGGYNFDEPWSSSQEAANIVEIDSAKKSEPSNPLGHALTNEALMNSAPSFPSPWVVAETISQHICDTFTPPKPNWISDKLSAWYPLSANSFGGTSTELPDSARLSSSCEGSNNEKVGNGTPEAAATFITTPLSAWISSFFPSSGAPLGGEAADLSNATKSGSLSGERSVVVPNIENWPGKAELLAPFASGGRAMSNISTSGSSLPSSVIGTSGSDKSGLFLGCSNKDAASPAEEGEENKPVGIWPSSATLEATVSTEKKAAEDVGLTALPSLPAPITSPSSSWWNALYPFSRGETKPTAPSYNFSSGDEPPPSSSATFTIIAELKEEGGKQLAEEGEKKLSEQPLPSAAMSSAPNTFKTVDNKKVQQNSPSSGKRGGGGRWWLGGLGGGNSGHTATSSATPVTTTPTTSTLEEVPPKAHSTSLETSPSHALSTSSGPTPVVMSSVSSLHGAPKQHEEAVLPVEDKMLKPKKGGKGEEGTEAKKRDKIVFIPDRNAAELKATQDGTHHRSHEQNTMDVEGERILGFEPYPKVLDTLFSMRSTNPQDREEILREWVKQAKEGGAKVLEAAERGMENVMGKEEYKAFAVSAGATMQERVQALKEASKAFYESMDADAKKSIRTLSRETAEKFVPEFKTKVKDLADQTELALKQDIYHPPLRSFPSTKSESGVSSSESFSLTPEQQVSFPDNADESKAKEVLPPTSSQNLKSSSDPEINLEKTSGASQMDMASILELMKKINDCEIYCPEKELLSVKPLRTEKEKK